MIPRDKPLEIKDNKTGNYIKVEYDAGMRVWFVNVSNVGYRMNMTEEEILHRYPQIKKYCRELEFQDSVNSIINGAE